MLTLMQKLIVFSVLIVIDIVSLLFFGVLAIVPIIFTIVIAFQLRRM